MAIENNKGFNMPLTGGDGFVRMVMIGAGLLGGGTYAFVKSRKKKETEKTAC